jgi:hypothetical protein
MSFFIDQLTIHKSSHAYQPTCDGFQAGTINRSYEHFEAIIEVSCHVRPLHEGCWIWRTNWYCRADICSLFLSSGWLSHQPLGLGGCNLVVEENTFELVSKGLAALRRELRLKSFPVSFLAYVQCDMGNISLNNSSLRVL